jgi:hypothetical protein
MLVTPGSGAGSLDAPLARQIVEGVACQLVRLEGEPRRWLQEPGAGLARST